MKDKAPVSRHEAARLLGQKGGSARAAKMTPEERRTR